MDDFGYATEGGRMKARGKWRRWWKHRLTYHPPKTDEHRHAHERIGQICEDAGTALIDVCPGGEELEFALQALREVRMWANASQAIHGNSGADMESVPTISTAHLDDEEPTWRANHEE